MSLSFAGSEVVELGIQIEKNGRDFYNVLARSTENQKAKEVFEYLAGEEEKHIGVFQKLHDHIQAYDPPEAYPEEYFTYMKALAADTVFTQADKGEETAKEMKSDKEAIDFAIKAEKDSMVFFESMKEVTVDNDHKIINALIKQEQSHLHRLLDIKRELF